MLSHRRRTNRVASLSITNRDVYWLLALTVGVFLFSYYYYFAEVWPALLPAGWG